MAKIKRKVEMTLPQLIEWGFKNNIKNREFSRNHKYFKPVVFNSCGYVDFRDDYAYSPEDTFTVEVEEEITEDTVFPVLVKVIENVVKEIKVISYYNASINSSKSQNETLSYHILNDDGTMTLIWKDGAMVDD
ncbi:hypothetical protein K4Q40_02755 [Staphylococcus epidermidis]|nr:hypothetical protein [Staphylococcus epidermidis]